MEKARNSAKFSTRAGPGRAGLARLAGLAALALVPNRAAAVTALAADHPAYADLVDLADSAPLVLRVELRKVVPVEPERAGRVRPGRARVYVEARVLDALRGSLAAPQVRYLADVMLDARGRVPNLGKQIALLVARPGTGAIEGSGKEASAEIQLVAPDAQLWWGPELEGRLRAVLAELQAPGAPGPVSGVREARFEAGTLAGAGETQIFLTTPDGAPAALSVVHVPDQPTLWSASFSEVANGGLAPARETLAWYRLACFLPATLPPAANPAADEGDRARAAADYGFVMAALGPCGRTRQ